VVRNTFGRWHLKGKPYAVQVEALKRSKGHDKYGFFLEQGLGKSPLVINEYIDRFTEYDTVVILAPNSYKLDWTLIPSEWGVDIDTGMWPRDPCRPGTSSRPYIYVMNYESARATGYEHLKVLMNSRPCMLVCDESFAFKNFRSQTARAVLDLSKRAKVVRLLNGTPMSNNVLDLYPQLRAIGQLDRMNPYAFRNRFAVTGGFMGKQIVGVKNEPELHKILDACSFRAMKKDWSDLPPKINIPVRLEMTATQRKLYKEMLEDFYTLVNGEEFTANMVLGRLDKLRQIASGLLIEGDKFALLEAPADNPKIKATLDIIESGPGKVVIVHYYKKIGRVIFDTMEEHGYSPAYIRGDMEPDELIFQKKKFNDDPSCRVLVAQITTASRAHTLLGGTGNDRACRMVFHDSTFSLVDRSQMEDRFHRGEQDRTCYYYDLITSPIDEAQINALIKKQDVASAVVDAVRALRI
jgi:SNF2 family DNA or RNA helicase